MDDLNIVSRIDERADKEHKLERAHAGEPLSGSDLERLRAIEVALDQCWDLLRQRRQVTSRQCPHILRPRQPL